MAGFRGTARFGDDMTATGLLCGSCGAQSSTTAKFCNKCGAPVTQVTRSAEYKHVTVLPYPMASMRSRNARKLTANAPAPIAAVAPTAQP